MKKEESFLTNITKLYVLNSLSKYPKHGYELIEKFNSVTGNRLSSGQIYPLLRKMQTMNSKTNTKDTSSSRFYRNEMYGADFDD